MTWDCGLMCDPVRCALAGCVVHDSELSRLKDPATVTFDFFLLKDEEMLN